MKIERFWAKTSPEKEKPNAFHPLICHLIDVGVTAKAMWKEVLPISTKRKLAHIFGLENNLEQAGKMIAFLIGLHDLGKCSPPFALRGKNEKGRQTERLLALYADTDCDCENFSKSSDVPHGFVTSLELPAILHDKFNFPELLAKSIAEIIGGHHGIFATSGKLNEIKKLNEKSIGGEAWQKSRRELVERFASLFDVKGNFLPLPNEKLDNPTAMIFAGLTTTADWIGSNADFFECEIADSTKDFTLDLNKYLKKSERNAEKALKTLGWTKWLRETTEKSFSELFPKIEKPRHLQNVAQEIAKEIDSVGFAIVESPMGEGKTEAAMFLADAFNARRGTRGIYFALPTQATSNQMFGRIENFLKERFKGEDLNVQLMLQHGHSSISAEFVEKIENFRNIQNTYDDAENKISNIAAAEWFTYKKRGLLVPFGVGTIDQILLGVLQTKHVFVRLFGLAHKTVIIDEVHAYDAYMSTLLERLLEWLAALGSPVIILSATLPRKKRDALTKAYLTGLGKAVESDELERIGEADKYPRISYSFASMPDKTFRIRQLETSPQNEKTLYLEWKDESNFIDELKGKLIARGGCVAIICNTVDKAQTLYDELTNDKFFQGLASDNLPKLDLLHARFRYFDREKREKNALLRFGKKGEKVTFTENGKNIERDVTRPDCAVLISTQIIEQSLDLDFDLMISELAPADLLLQRAGRLQRHSLPERILNKNLPTLWLLKPPIDENGDLIITEKGLPDFGKSGVVYDKHILLRSWLKLRDGKPIKIPGNIEELIEDVYDKKCEFFDENYLNIWNDTKVSLDKKLTEKRQKAKAVYLTDFDDEEFYDSFNFQLDEDDPEKHSTLRAHTRDEERPTVAVVLLTRHEVQSINLSGIPSRETGEFLIKREVKISRGGLTQAILANPEFKTPSWEKSALLRHHRLLIFNESNEITIGETIVFLDEEKGVEYKTKGGKSE